MTGIAVTLKDKVCSVKFIRPKKKNALRNKDYLDLMATLDQASRNPDVAVVAVTGEGDYFTAGHDFVDTLKNMGNEADSPEEKEATEQKSSPKLSVFGRFIASLINFPKPLVAVVNGPAVGMGVTMLAHCDAVYASDKATFHTPFVNLGVVAEGCSSYIYPRLMGMGKAAEVLLFGKKLTAREACDRGLVTEVFPNSDIHQVWSRIYEYARLPPNTLVRIKEIMRIHEKETLLKVNVMEMDYLKEAIKSEETLSALMNAFAKKSKL